LGELTALYQTPWMDFTGLLLRGGGGGGKGRERGSGKKKRKCWRRDVPQPTEIDACD